LIVKYILQTNDLKLILASLYRKSISVVRNIYCFLGALLIFFSFCVVRIVEG